MSTWESIIEDYLEGSSPRAAAESLRFRIAMPTEARREVEAVLRLADRLADATRRAGPPAGAAQRLLQCLRPSGKPVPSPTWIADRGDFVASDAATRPGADEDAVNAAIEGAPAARCEKPTLPKEQSLADFDRIAAAVSSANATVRDDAVPSGAVQRLRARLADSFASDEGGASPAVARRILARLRGEAAPPSAGYRPPDVLAAGNEPEDDPTDAPAGH